MSVLRRARLQDAADAAGRALECAAQAARDDQQALAFYLRGEAIWRTATPQAREPFKRLVDTGVRLNQIRSATDLYDFLIDEVSEISGAERTLRVLEPRPPLSTPVLPFPAERTLAGSWLPNGEEAEALFRRIGPLLDEARGVRGVLLHHIPPDAGPFEQKSVLVAPLVAQREVLGYLYADLDGMFGRFHDTDRDLIGMLAGQAAVALANLRFSEELNGVIGMSGVLLDSAATAPILPPTASRPSRASRARSTTWC